MNLYLTTRRHLLQRAFLALCTLLSACFLTEVMPADKKKPPAAPVATKPTKKPETVLLRPSELPPWRLLRRLSLDIQGRLPYPEDGTALAETPTDYPRIVDAYLDSAAANKALANLHTRMWKLDFNRLADLDRLAANDSTLAAQLTAAVREEIVNEPAQIIRYILEHQRPFADAFTIDFAIVHADTLPIWNLSSSGIAFAGERYQIVLPTDARPAAGILSSRGLFAALSSTVDVTRQHRTTQLLATFLCQNPTAENAHHYFNLSDSVLASGPAAVATRHKNCAGCHTRLAGPTAASAGLAEGNDLTAWLTYTPPDTTSGALGGRAFTNWQQFARQLANDPRMVRCEATRLLTTLSQRRLTDEDTNVINIAVASFATGGGMLKELVRPILLSRSYKQDVVTKNTNVTLQRKLSGARFLSRWHWRQIIAQIAPTATALELPVNLEAGYDDPWSDETIPMGMYWHDLDRLARQLATAIIAAELADDSPAYGRSLLTLLPDGSAAEATAALVDQQIIAIWTQLSSISLTAKSPELKEFKNLWLAAKAKGLAGDDSRRAWRTLLTAMLSHPDFITY